MMPPPIRYPLPTLAGLIVAAILLWKGSALARPVFEAVAERVRKAAEGPDYPASDGPRFLAGPIRDRVLLLRDETRATDRPGGATIETISKRGFFDVYDAWPLSGEPTHFRIGARAPIGWVEAGAALRWPTRLALRRPGGSVELSRSPGGADTATVQADASPMPILRGEGDRVEVAAWEPGAGWQEVAQVGWTRPDRTEVGVMLARPEVVAMLGKMLAPRSETEADALRLRALTGRVVLETRAISAADVAEAGRVLPAVALERGGLSDREKTDGLARLNEEWSPDATWGGLEFRLVPLDLLP
jgi:hypothetical protein